MKNKHIDIRAIKIRLAETSGRAGRSGKTLRRFAEQIGYDYGWVSKIINNRETRYNPEIIQQLAAYLEMPLSAIITDSPDCNNSAQSGDNTRTANV
jgi:transcriptional regulator with XRE-family HTH domain